MIIFHKIEESNKIKKFQKIVKIEKFKKKIKKRKRKSFAAEIYLKCKKNNLPALISRETRRKGKS